MVRLNPPSSVPLGTSMALGDSIRNWQELEGGKGSSDGMSRGEMARRSAEGLVASERRRPSIVLTPVWGLVWDSGMSDVQPPGGQAHCV